MQALARDGRSIPVAPITLKVKGQGKLWRASRSSTVGGCDPFPHRELGPRFDPGPGEIAGGGQSARGPADGTRGPRPDFEIGSSPRYTSNMAQARSCDLRSGLRSPLTTVHSVPSGCQVKRSSFPSFSSSREKNPRRW